jgi:hypothetical protein
MKAFIETPSGRKVEFGHDEKIRFKCDEKGTHWLGASGEDGRWLYRELNNLHPGMIIQADPVGRWNWPLEQA